MFNSRQMLSMNLLGMKTDAGVLLKMLKGEQYGPAQVSIVFVFLDETGWVCRLVVWWFGGLWVSWFGGLWVWWFGGL